MIKKLLTSFVIFTFYLASLPAYGGVAPGDNTIVNDPEGDIPISRPIQPVTSGVELNVTPSVATAVFPFVDANGNLYDINVDFNTRSYSVTTAGQFVGVGTLTTAQAFTLRDIAEDATDPELQCPLICQILIAAVFTGVGVVLDRVADSGDCVRDMERDRREARHDAAAFCPQNYYDGNGNYCVHVPQYSAAEPALCMGENYIGCRKICG